MPCRHNDNTGNLIHVYLQVLRVHPNKRNYLTLYASYHSLYYLQFSSDVHIIT